MTTTQKGWSVLAIVVCCTAFVCCTLPTVNMGGFPCENDRQCGLSARCIGGTCGGSVGPSETTPLQDTAAQEVAQETTQEAAQEAAQEATQEASSSDGGVGEDAGSPEREVISEREPELSPEVPPEARIPQFRWVMTLGGETRYVYQRGSPLVTKDAIYALGAYQYYKGNVPTPAHGGTYGMIAKLDTQGSALWVESIQGDTPDIRIHSGAASSDGMLIVVGAFFGRATFGSSQSSIQRSSFGAGDAFVAKFDPKTRRFLWVSSFGGPGYDEAWTVFLDAKDNVYVSGSVAGKTHTFTTDGKQSSLLPNQWPAAKGSAEAFVLKLDAAGRLLWGRVWGSPKGWDRAHVYPDRTSDARLFVTIAYQEQLFDTKNSLILSGTGTASTALLTLDANTGEAKQSKSLQGDKRLQLSHLAQEATTGDIFLAGGFDGNWSVKLQNGQTKTLVPRGSVDIGLLRITQQGQLLWATSFGGPNDEALHDMLLSPQNTLMMIGVFTTSTSFGPLQLQNTQQSNVSTGFFLQADTQQGKPLQAQAFSGAWNNLHSISRAPRGTLYLFGSLRGAVLFDAKNKTTLSPKHAPGGADSFLLSLTP